MLELQKETHNEDVGGGGGLFKPSPNLPRRAYSKSKASPSRLGVGHATESL
jgi:hypothetical protein